MREDRKAAAAAVEALEELVRACLRRREGGHLIERELDRLVLEVDLPLRAGAAALRDRPQALAAQVDELIDDALQHAAVFRPGHAWCHRCGVATCEHSAPPSSRHVFVGYAPTGSPRWIDFAQHCLDLRHPDVDRLYAERPAFLTLVHGSEPLHGGLLDAFDDRRYRLLGQVTAGFFATPAAAHEGRGVVALSIQASLSRTRRGRPRVGLNLLARAPSGEPLERLWDRQDELPWQRSVRWAQHAVSTLATPRSRGGRRARHEQAELERRLEGILKGLARRLERDQRARGRRTRHAQERHRSGERPTRKAIEDLRAAADDAFLIDRRSGAVVVLGDRGRTHFFSPDGKLVSSVRYSRDAIARKVKSEQWQDVPPGRREELRRAFEPAGGG